jgi:prepilin peptidase CpaA
MPPTEIARWTVASLFTGILAWAAVSDIRVRKIPNWTILALLGLFAPWALLNTGNWVLWTLVAGAIALAVSVGLYAAGVVGAGDSKLYAAVALFTGLTELPRVALVTALAGGVIAAISLATRPNRALIMLTLRGKGDFGRGIPYGVAIAIAGATLVWARLLGVPLTWDLG